MVGVVLEILIQNRFDVLLEPLEAFVLLISLSLIWVVEVGLWVVVARLLLVVLVDFLENLNTDLVVVEDVGSDGFPLRRAEVLFPNDVALLVLRVDVHEIRDQIFFQSCQFHHLLFCESKNE